MCTKVWRLPPCALHLATAYASQRLCEKGRVRSDKNIRKPIPGQLKCLPRHGIECEKSLAVASADVPDPADPMDHVLRQPIPETCRFNDLLPLHKPHPAEEWGGWGSVDRSGQQGRACTRRAGTEVEDPRQRVAGSARPDQRHSDPHTPRGNRSNRRRPAKGRMAMSLMNMEARNPWLAGLISSQYSHAWPKFRHRTKNRKERMVFLGVVTLYHQ